ncbi:hypothetical protein ECG_05649 [Echinococcus granulosus]|nr:hypothetical protein ECG_05649 [Echinococcus granulosus]
MERLGDYMSPKFETSAFRRERMSIDYRLSTECRIFTHGLGQRQHQLHLRHSAVQTTAGRGKIKSSGELRQLNNFPHILIMAATSTKAFDRSCRYDGM